VGAERDREEKADRRERFDFRSLYSWFLASATHGGFSSLCCLSDSFKPYIPSFSAE
jgi:hypothetical protein